MDQNDFQADNEMTKHYMRVVLNKLRSLHQEVLDEVELSASGAEIPHERLQALHQRNMELYSTLREKIECMQGKNDSIRQQLKVRTARRAAPGS